LRRPDRIGMYTRLFQQVAAFGAVFPGLLVSQWLVW
jgi:hypothetical protein